MANNQATDVEIENIQRNHWIEQAEALERLMEHPDFKLVILDGYIEKKALDGVSLLALPAIKKAGERTDVMEDLVSISNLQYHFDMVRNLGSVSQEDLLEEETE